MIRLALAIVLALAGAAAAETPLSRLLDAERGAIARLPMARLASLVDRPEQQLQYSADWLAQQPIKPGGEQWRCLAEALYFEARGETVKGQFAVAEVILNRVDSAEFPDDICSVVHQGTGKKFRCQFTYTCDGREEKITEPRAFEHAGKVARLMIAGAPRALTGGATYYHARTVRPSWARKMLRTATIGSHRFYRRPTRISSN